MTDQEFFELRLAVEELTKSELKVWVYLSQNKGRSHSTSCSTAAFMSRTLNISEPTVKRAIAKLKDLKLDYLLENWN
jgi:DNA-binding MurR/RpiR family transcriptional regulator